MLNKNEKGFTLIELITAVAILAVLSVVAIVSLRPDLQFQKSNDAKRKSDLFHIQQALETYYHDNGKYPKSTTDDLFFIQSLDANNNALQWGGPWKPYMEVLPKDPQYVVGSMTTRRYIYYSDGQSYKLYASLERGADDLQACNGGNACSGVPTTSGGSVATCGGIYTCNYGVSSPNISP